MAEKKVVVMITHPPFGSIYYTEGLRAAVGVTSGIDEHTVDVLLLGDGVYYALNNVDRKDSAKYIQTLTGINSSIYAEEESLKERGINSKELSLFVRVISRKEALRLLLDANHTIDF